MVSDPSGLSVVPGTHGGMLIGGAAWSRLAVLWAKAEKRPEAWHPLWAHALDAAAAADWLWARGLAPSARRQVSAWLPGGDEDGRLLLRWLAALHDLGKASPAFQVQHEARAAATRLVLELPLRLPGRENAPHSWVSAAVLLRMLEGRGWSRRAALWPAMVVGGHHGAFPGLRFAREPKARPDLYGDGVWSSMPIRTPVGSLP